MWFVLNQNLFIFKIDFGFTMKIQKKVLLITGNESCTIMDNLEGTDYKSVTQIAWMELKIIMQSKY